MMRLCGWWGRTEKRHLLNLIWYFSEIKVLLICYPLYFPIWSCKKYSDFFSLLWSVRDNKIRMIFDQYTQKITKEVTNTHSSHYLIMIVFKFLIVISKSYLAICNVIMDLNKMACEFFSHVTYKWYIAYAFLIIIENNWC